MFDLLFLALVLTTLIVLLAGLVQLARRRFGATGRLFLFYGLGLALYFSAVSAVGLTSPQRVVPMHEDRCFDEWCLAVTDLRVEDTLGGTKASGVYYVIELRISNHARRQAQRAASAAIHLLDQQGRQYDLSSAGMLAFENEYGSIPPLTLRMEPGDSYVTFQVFDLPKDAGAVSLTVEHPVGFSPGWFIIGDESSLFHKPTIVPLP
jgi:hypothetical protein